MTNSKQKGKRFELFVAHLFQSYGFPARRSQQYCGSNGDADVVGVDGVHIECKANEHLNLYDAIKQSHSDAKPGEIPIVVHKKNNKPVLVTVEFNDFMELWKGGKNGQDY